MSTIASMLERFRERLEKSELIPLGSRVLVGYSGGCDSTALLHMLHEEGIDVVAAHLHHGQREEAEEELERCQAFADELGIPFVSGRADVPRMAREMKMGLEEAGRQARYGFFSEAAFRLDCNLIATAHTRNDLVETVLLNIVRGSGLNGLTGIPERRENIIRPILSFSRQDTQTYCALNGFWTHEDPANTDLTFARARMRNRVVPELAKIHEGFEHSIVRLANIAGEEDQFLNGMAAAALEQAEIKLNGSLEFLSNDSEIRFDRHQLAHLPAVLLKRALRLAVGALGESLTHLQTMTAFDGIVLGESSSVTCDGGEVVLEWSDGKVNARRLTATAPFRHTLTFPGETLSDEFGWRFEAFEADWDGEMPKRAELETSIRIDAPRGNLYFRTAQAGDAMRPLGFDGKRKVSDLLSEAKLTETARSRLPIVCDMVGPLWIPGICLDERARPTTQDKRVIRLRFGPLKS